jgi:glycosyltransferase involved in cell wall biosynthesis
VRVALDAQLTIGTATGIGEYVRGLADALRRRNVDVVELRQPALDPWRFDRRVIWDQLVLPRRARASRAQLLHCAAGTMPRQFGMPIVVTVHDLAWHRVQAHAPAYARYYFGPFSLRRCRHAARVVVDSAFSRDEFLRLLGDFDPARVEVVYPGVAADFCTLERRGGDGRTILAVGTVERRKNLGVIVRALRELPRARLVAIGPLTPYARECEALARRLGVADRLEMPGYLPRARLVEFYERCAVAAVPSRYEGFGYAAAQALCAGVPCVVSDCASLPEVAGEDAPIVPADDAAAWTAALGAVLNGDDGRWAARARQAAIARFSWETSAERFESIYAASIDG